MAPPVPFISSTGGPEHAEVFTASQTRGNGSMLIHIKCGRTVSGRKAPGRALDHAGGGSVNKGIFFSHTR